MAEPKHLLVWFGIHQRLESCGENSVNEHLSQFQILCTFCTFMLAKKGTEF